MPKIYGIQHDILIKLLTFLIKQFFAACTFSPATDQIIQRNDTLSRHPVVINPLKNNAICRIRQTFTELSLWKKDKQLGIGILLIAWFIWTFQWNWILMVIFSTARCSSVPSCLRYIPSHPSIPSHPIPPTCKFECSKLFYARPASTKLL